MKLRELQTELRRLANPKKAEIARWYFKSTEKDDFLGVMVPERRILARQAQDLSLEDIKVLVSAPFHEERSVGNMILVRKFEKGDEKQKKRVFDFLIKHRKTLRSWDAVDETAPYIVGPYLMDRDKSLLYKLARSKVLWDRRIAIVATIYFIRKGHLEDTFRIVELLMEDQEDLIHKACGWMLREAGKKDMPALEAFLRTHYSRLPRTALRYSIERFPEPKRLIYLKGAL